MGPDSEFWAWYQNTSAESIFLLLSPTDPRKDQFFGGKADVKRKSKILCMEMQRGSCRFMSWRTSDMSKIEMVGDSRYQKIAGWS